MNYNITELTLNKFVNMLEDEDKHIERVINTEEGVIVRLGKNE